MFDSRYFQNALPAQVAAVGEGPTVEVFIIGGHAHRVRGIDEIAEGYVILEVYQRRGEVIGTVTPWQGNARPPAAVDDTHRAAISYDAISQVIITRTASASAPRIGF